MTELTVRSADENHAKFGGDTSIIPTGSYCYQIISIEPNDQNEGGLPTIKTKTCPYWGSDVKKSGQDNGYCAHLKTGDWDGDGFSLLWDFVKECGINEGIESESLDSPS
jgi:hypothetical protein